MSDLAFPMTAVLVTITIVIPIFTLLMSVMLRSIRSRITWIGAYGSSFVLGLIALPVLIPLILLVLSSIHEFFDGIVCLIDSHGQELACTDALMLLILTGTGLFASVGYIWATTGSDPHARASSDKGLMRRLSALKAQLPALKATKLLLVETSPDAAFTAGLVRPWIGLDESFAKAADDEALKAALLHEHEHLRGRDGLRVLLVKALLLLNPARCLLRSELERWRAAREAICDHQAVARGGDPLALAQALVQAARHTGRRPATSAIQGLFGPGAALLRLRLLLLAEYQAGRSAMQVSCGAWGGVIFAISLPFLWGAFISLTWLHVTVERWFLS